MTRRDMTICDGCGRQTPTDETVGWYELYQRRDPLYDLTTVGEENQAAQHFCDLVCLARAIPAPPPGSRPGIPPERDWPQA